MELCTARPISNTTLSRPFSSGNSRFSKFDSNRHVSNVHGIGFKFTGLRNYAKLSLKLSSSDEISVSSYAKDGPDGVITVEETKPVEKQEYEDKVTSDAPEESPSEGYPNEGNITQVFESFLEKLDLEKIDADDKYSLLLLGAGGLTALYLATSVVSAIDSIPLVPKLMQLVGLSYTVWFTARYLVLKENRAELAAKINDIKEKVLGSD